MKAQTYPNIELIVSDNYSDDDTVKIAKSFRTRIIITPDSERSEQTNIAAKTAKGEYICRIDSDVVIEPKVIEEAMNEIAKGYDAIKIFGTNDDSVSFWAKVRKMEREMYQGDWMHSAPCFFRKDAFWAVGGFNESLSVQEEFDLQNRLIKAGYRIGMIGAKALHLGEPESLSDIARKYVFYGEKIDTFLKANPKKGSWQISPIRLIYVRHWRDFSKDAKLTFGFFLYHLVKYLSALIGFTSKKAINSKWWQ